MKKLFFLISILFLVNFVFAQQPHVEVSKKYSQIFSNLTKSQIKTGFLRDKSTGETDWTKINSAKSQEAVNSHEFRQIYFELSKSSIDNSLISFDKMLQRTQNLENKRVFPVSIINVDYNKLEPNAEEKGLVSVKNGKFIAKSSEVFLTKHLFVAGVFSQRKYTGKQITFSFNQQFFVSNKQKPEYFLVDFGNGNGARKVSLNQKVEINYSKDGLKKISLTAVFANQKTEKTSFSLEVKTSSMPTPNETWNQTADIAYKGSYAKIDAGIFLGAGHTKITRPIVIVDGFDPTNSRDVPEIYDIANQENMFNDLLAKGYDAIVVNFLSGADYIQRNAFALVKVLQTINARMQSAGTYGNKIVLIGPSMGGLVTRYALRYMELHNMKHNVSTWISFDSPQKGATVPLGLQHWVRFFADVADNSDAKLALDALNAPAAQQMLIYHYTSTYTGQFPNPYFSSFYNEINSMGYPQNVRRVAIINGSGYGNGQAYGPGYQLIRYHYNSWLVDIVGDVWAVPNVNTQNTIFHGILDILGPWYDEETITYADTRPLDGAPGGQTNTLEQMDQMNPKYGDIVAYYKNHCFIPSISSLALDNTTNVYYNVAANMNNIQTPFDKIYFPNWNQDHMHIDAQSKAWFDFEIMNAPKTSPSHNNYVGKDLRDRPNSKLESKHINGDEVTVFPNPASDYVFVTNAQEGNVTISDMQGKVYLNKNVSNMLEKIDLNTFPKGIYIMSIKTSKKSLIKKLIVD